MKNRSLIWIIVLLLSACQMQKITVDVYETPHLEFPPDLSYYLVSSRYVPATGPYENVQWGSYETVDTVKWALSRTLVDSLGAFMASDSLYHVRVAHDLRMLRHNGSDLPEPLPWEGMLKIGEANHVQAILLLEGFDMSRTPIETTSSEGKFMSSFTIHVTTAWRSYDLPRRRLVEQAVYEWDTLFYSTGSSVDASQAELPSLLEASKEACNYAARSYFNSFRPGSVPEERLYYPDGDERLIKANEAIQKGDWKSAERDWYYLAYRSEDTLIQAKASYNMAVVCERNGKLNQALAYVRRSQKLHPDRKTLEYINILNTKVLDYVDKVDEKKIIRRW